MDYARGLADGCGLPRAEKKSLSDALPEIVERGTTHHPLLAAISLARMINQASGGAVIAPWEVDELPETWLDGFRFLEQEAPAAAQARQQVQKLKSGWLSSHPTYGKR